ncbi:hypothetical protein like AT4G35140 [Hibiscus trionum]|uniref:Uncharacterized protein n=1 Tax=Hibiscus trionum TaxID=183268 RepID=A0A9W7I0T2_HIBTR|nr:hypothetical protein like AT4G35140 [Hibiscus trionum]
MRNGKAKASVDTAVVDVWRRELGELSNRKFANRIAASEDLVLRLDNSHIHVKDQSCADRVTFNAAGNILVSGSPDKRVSMWDWEPGISKISFNSGHKYIDSHFVVKIMPYTGDHSLVMCSADGQVRHALIMEGGVQTRMIANHMQGAFDLAVEPGSPNIFYSCGADGLVNHFDLRRRRHLAVTQLFKCQPIDDPMLIRGFIPLYHIAFDPVNPNLFAVSGCDKYTRLYDIRKSKQDSSTDFGQPIDHFYPPHLIGDHEIGVTGMAFSDQSELLVSYGDSSICLFTRDMGLGHDPVPSSRGEASEKVIPRVYKGLSKKERSKSVSFFGPKSEYVVVGSEFGRMFIWKKKGGELVRVMKAVRRRVNFIESHPQTSVLASCGSLELKIWTPKAVDKAVLPTQNELDQQVQERSMYRFLPFP